MECHHYGLLSASGISPLFAFVKQRLVPQENAKILVKSRARQLLFSLPVWFDSDGMYNYCILYCPLSLSSSSVYKCRYCVAQWFALDLAQMNKMTSNYFLLTFVPFVRFYIFHSFERKKKAAISILESLNLLYELWLMCTCLYVLRVVSVCVWVLRFD